MSTDLLQAQSEIRSREKAMDEQRATLARLQAAALTWAAIQRAPEKTSEILRLSGYIK